MAGSLDPFSQIQINYEKLYGIAQELTTAATLTTESEETFRKVEGLYGASMVDLRRIQQNCAEGGAIKAGYEGQFLRATQLDARIDSIYKRICHRYRTFAPTFHIPAERPVAEERRPINSLRSTSASLLSYLASHSIDMETCEYRAILGDGNCFYHSVATHIIDSGKIDSFIPYLTPALRLSPEHEASLRTFLENAKRDPEGAIKNTDGMMQFVRALREITALEIQNHFAEYEPIFRATLADEFPDDGKTVEDASDDFILIKDYVQEMGKEASFICIQALSNALKLPVVVHDTRIGSPTLVGFEARASAASAAMPTPIDVVKSGQHYYLLHLEPTRAAAEAPRLSYQPVTVYYSGSSRPFIRGEAGSALETRTSGGGAASARAEETKALSWDRGIPMNQTGPNSWQLMVTPGAKFKVLIDDAMWSEGDNVTVSASGPTEVFPPFEEVTTLAVHADAGMGNRFAICGKGRIRLNDKIVDLSWDSKKAIPLTCYAASFWGLQVDVMTPGECKVVKLHSDGKEVWEKAENRHLSPHSTLDIRPEF